MFKDCNNLVNIDLSPSFYNTKNLKNMNVMFYKCHKLKNVNLSSFIVQNVVNYDGMIEGCKNLSKPYYLK